MPTLHLSFEVSQLVAVGGGVLFFNAISDKEKIKNLSYHPEFYCSSCRRVMPLLNAKMRASEVCAGSLQPTCVFRPCLADGAAPHPQLPLPPSEVWKAGETRTRVPSSRSGRVSDSSVGTERPGRPPGLGWEADGPLCLKGSPGPLGSHAISMALHTPLSRWISFTKQHLIEGEEVTPAEP